MDSCLGDALGKTAKGPRLSPGPPWPRFGDSAAYAIRREAVSLPAFFPQASAVLVEVRALRPEPHVAARAALFAAEPLHSWVADDLPAPPAAGLLPGDYSLAVLAVTGFQPDASPEAGWPLGDSPQPEGDSSPAACLAAADDSLPADSVAPLASVDLWVLVLCWRPAEQADLLALAVRAAPHSWDGR